MVFGCSLMVTIDAKNGVEVGGVAVIQHQAQKAMAQILLAGEGKTTCFQMTESHCLCICVDVICYT